MNIFSASEAHKNEASLSERLNALTSLLDTLQTSLQKNDPSAQNLIAELQQEIVATQAEAHTLLETLNFQQEIFEQINIPLFMVEALADGTFRYIGNNKSHRRITGLSFIAGKTPTEVMPESDAVALIRDYADCLEKNTSMHYHKEIAFPSGKKSWISYLTPLKHGNKNIIIGATHDSTAEAEEKLHLFNIISELSLTKDTIYHQSEELQNINKKLVSEIHQHEEARRRLRIEEERYRLLVENLPDTSVFLFQTNLSLVVCGGGLIEQSMSAGNTKPRNLYDLWDDEAEDIYKALAEGSSGALQTFRKDIQGVNYELRIVPLYDPVGEVSSVMLLVRHITATVLEEQELQAALQKTASLKNLLHTGIWEWDRTTKSLHWDHEMYILHGLPPEQSISYKAWFSFLTVTQQQQLEQLLFSSEPVKESFQMYYPSPLADSSSPILISITVPASPEMISQSKILGICRPLTFKESSAELFRGMIDNSSELMCALNSELHYLAFNTAYASFVESRLGLVLYPGMPFFVNPEDLNENIRPSWRVEMQSHLEEVLRGKTKSFTTTLINETVFEVTCSPIRKKDIVTGVYIFARDITRRQELIENLSRSQAFYTALLESVPAAIWSVDTNLSVVGFNKATEELTYRLTGKQVRLGENTLEYVAEIYQEQMRAAYIAAFQGEYQEISFEGGVSGTEMFTAFKVLIAPIRIADNHRVVGASVITIDLTEQKQKEYALQQAQEQAQLANKAKSEFIANMSHEIRTPLNSVLGFAEMLARDESDPKQLSYLEAIRSGGKSLLTIINDLLDLSKIEAGVLQLSSEPLSVEKLIQEVLLMFKHSIEHKNLRTETFFADTLPQLIVADETRLRQILINLIGNAIKFTSAGVISIWVEAIPSSEEKVKVLKIHVKDTGIGIAEEYLEDIFEPFKQIADTNTRLHGGAGLGLSICKKLAKTMNGNLLVQSRVKYGSTFTLELYEIPVASQQLHVHDTNIGNSELLLKEARILVVDDSQMNCRLVKEVLRPFGTKTTTCLSGESALELIRTEKFDAVLLDLHMPGMSGIEVAKYIKNNKMQDIPLLAFTAMNIDETIQNDIRTYFAGVISKPARRDEIVKNLQKHLSQPLESSSPIVTEQPIQLLAEARKPLEEIFTLLQEILRSRKMSDIAIFAENLVKFTQLYSLNDLTEKGKQLQQAIATFDIELMMQNLYSINDALRALTEDVQRTT